jgi:hypothetical protein
MYAFDELVLLIEPQKNNKKMQEKQKLKQQPSPTQSYPAGRIKKSSLSPKIATSIAKAIQWGCPRKRRLLPGAPKFLSYATCQIV